MLIRLLVLEKCPVNLVNFEKKKTTNYDKKKTYDYVESIYHMVSSISRHNTTPKPKKKCSQNYFLSTLH